LTEARGLSSERFGKRILFHLPGMFVLDGRRGRYPALSLTGEHCNLGCDHCRGRLLQPMIPATSPEELVERCIRLADEGAVGCLISGGCDPRGRLPWDRFVEALRRIKDLTHLHISVHTGMLLEPHQARALRQVGVDQALVDVVGDEETARKVLHLEGGLTAMSRTLQALAEEGLEMVPHICIGLHYGRIRGERRALELLRPFAPRRIVWIVLMPLPGTPMKGTPSPPLEEIGRLIAESRLLFPHAEISLGCARPRGRMRPAIERMAIDASINRMALFSEAALSHARSMGLDIAFRDTCCSVDGDKGRPLDGLETKPIWE